MEQQRLGNRYLADTAPFQVPISRSLRHLNQRSPRPETSTQNPYQEALESSFSRLSVSHNSQPSCPGSHGDILSGSSQDSSLNNFATGGHRFLPLLMQELLNNDIRTCGSMGFQDYVHYPGMTAGSGSDTDYWDGFVSGSYNGPVQTRNGSSSGGLLQQEYHYGSVNGLVSRNQNSLRSGGLYNNRPHWLQEPLNYLSLEDLRGRIVTLAKDQHGCRSLQRTIENISKEEIEMVFLEVINHVGELMVDPFGNYVVQKLIEVCTEEQRTQILLMLTKNEFQLVSICLNMHGTRAVQRLLDRITTPQQVSIVMSALSPGAVALTKDMNGHHVIQHCLKHFSDEDNKYLLNEVANNCYGIATDKSGCCVLQQCVEYSQGEPRDRLVAEIITNAYLLAEDRYGNYVVQHLLGLRDPHITVNLLRQLEGSYTNLSCNKYGSNVVEKCLSESREEQATRIIMELLDHPDASKLLLDPFGNYVIQSALSHSKGIAHRRLVELVQTNTPMMRSNIYGKKVLAWFDRRRLLYM